MSTQASSLPFFRYHPNPLATGALEQRRMTCAACGEQRDYAYVGPFYADEEIENICPWCISSGHAAQALQGEFHDPDFLGQVDDSSSIDELIHRTPGFTGWQQERWLSHCGDFCAYITSIANTEIDQFAHIIETLDTSESPDVATWLDARKRSNQTPLDRLLNGETPSRIHVFECLSCKARLSYLDQA